MFDIVQKLWGFCHTLRHDGVDYGDYIEQLTYLLFLKMAEERGADVPKGCDWASLKELAGTALTDHYADILRKLREAGGLLADIFAQATPRFNNPVNLKRVIAMIDEEDWSSMDVDVKGAAFEGLLEKAASEGKEGCRPILHAAPAHPIHLSRDEARSARKARVQNLRPGMRHRRFPRLRLRMTRRRIQRCPRPHRWEADQDQDILRPGPRPAPAPPRADESLPARRRAAHRARRHDLRARSR